MVAFRLEKTGGKPNSYGCVERYMALHKDWKEQITET